jgi:hypothetical protein
MYELLKFKKETKKTNFKNETNFLGPGSKFRKK